MDDLQLLGTLLAQPDPSREAIDRSRHRLREAMRHVPAGNREAGRLGRRSVRLALAACSTAFLAVGAGTAIFSATAPARHTSQATLQPVTMSADTTLRKDLDHTFPRHFVAAGHTAVAAYYTAHERPGDGPETIERTWYLYDPATGTYERTPWAYLDVAPGLDQAAVLEGPLPASRVGIVDMRTRKVIRWIPVAHPVGGVSWSPGGRRLLFTTYDKNPDTFAASSRTGYYVVDAASRRDIFHALPADPRNLGSRQDLGWSRSGKLIWAPTGTDPTKVFYDLGGQRQAAPAYEAGYDPEEAGLSPNGTLLPRFGPSPGPAVTVKNVRTGRAVAVLPIEQARAWADDDHLFAVGCDPKKCSGKGEFRNRLLLVSLTGKITPLTGYRRSDQNGSWVPLFTHR